MELKSIEKGDSYNAILKNFIGDNPKQLEQFIQNYIESLLVDIKNLEMAVANENNLEIATISHKMQTMIGQLEEKELYNLLQKLETQAKNGKVSANFELLLHKLEKFKEKLATNHIA